jgi:hypothetical protein
MAATLKLVSSLIGKRCEALQAVPAIVFDWAAISKSRQTTFLDDLFGDWDDSKAFRGLVARSPKGAIAWASDAIVPFALLGVDTRARSWRFTGGDEYPQFNTLLLFEHKTGAVLGLDVDGGAIQVPRPKRIAKSLTALALGHPAPPAKLVKGAPPSPAAYKAVHGALEAVTNALFQLSCWTGPYPNKAKAKLWAAKCEAALARLTRAITKVDAFAQHRSISKIPARYAGYVKAIDWGPKTIAVIQNEARFFERAASVPRFDLDEYDGLVALKK